VDVRRPVERSPGAGARILLTPARVGDAGADGSPCGTGEGVNVADPSCRAAVVRLWDMGRITFGDRAGWSAPDAEVAELLAVAAEHARSPDTRAALVGAYPGGELRLEAGAPGRSVALSLRVAIGLICARYLATADRSPTARAQRDRLYELDQLLQPLIAPRRGKYPTFPSRRHHEQLTARGIEPAAVAPLIGLPLEEAAGEAGKLGLRVSTAYRLMNRSERKLDVLADDGDVTNILGLHID
jgi:hypothetical protein